MGADFLRSEHFVKHMQCSRDSKEDIKDTVRMLVDLAVTARDEGIFAMDDLVADSGRFPDVFLQKAVHAAADIPDCENIKKVLYNFIFSSNFTSRRFLSAVIITEVMAALSRKEDTDYIFGYLVPSFFGLDFDSEVTEIYRSHKLRKVEELENLRTAEAVELSDAPKLEGFGEPYGV